MQRHRDAIASVLLGLADLLAVNLIIGGAVYLRFYWRLLPYPVAPQGGRALWTFWGAVHVTLFPALVLLGAYRMPRRWRSNEALPVVVQALLLALPLSTALLYAARFGVARGAGLQPLSRLFVFLAWGGLLVGLTGVRLLAGRLQLALYRRGLCLRRSVIVGDGAQAAQMVQRIERNPWLGERVVGCVDGEPDLAQVIQRHQADVVWLAPPEAPQANWLPPLLFEPGGTRLVWRVLPQGLQRLRKTALPCLDYERLQTLYRRLQHRLALPTLRVAMLGSRGVPANYSGVEKYVQEVGYHLAQEGAQVAVYCHKKYVSARGNYRGMELRFTPTLPTKHLETICHTFLATLHAWLQGAEIFHYQALGPSTLAWLPRLLGRKVVCTVQGLDWDRAKWGPLARRYLRFGEWAACHFPHRTIVVSRTLAQHYAQQHGKQTFYVPNGFEAPVRQPPRLIKDLGLEQDSYALFVGRLSPEKGCHTLLRAFAQVQSDKHLVLAGRATYDDRYQRQLLTEAQGLESVHFTGFVQGDVLRELYSNAYLVVLPSEMEGLSVSLLEALGYGNCLLVSDIPENLEAVGEAGYSFRNGDSQDLAQCLQWLFDQPERQQAARARTRARASGLMDWRDVARETRRLYESLYD